MWNDPITSSSKARAKLAYIERLEGLGHLLETGQLSLAFIMEKNYNSNTQSMINGPTWNIAYLLSLVKEMLKHG